MAENAGTRMIYNITSDIDDYIKETYKREATVKELTFFSSIINESMEKFRKDTEIKKERAPTPYETITYLQDVIKTLKVRIEAGEFTFPIAEQKPQK